MLSILIFSVIIGLDNLQVAASIGLMNLPSSSKWKIAIAFGLFEALMPLMGLLGGRFIFESMETSTEYIGSLVLFICGLAIIYQTYREQEADYEFLNSKWMLFGLPLSLSFDNFFAGVGLGALGYPIVMTATILGVVSAGMCFVGLFFGQQIRQVIERFLPVKAEMVSGIMLLMLAVWTFFEGGA